MSVRDTAKRLDSIGEKLEALSAILITHEHSDHVSGLVRLSKRLRIPIYMTRLTAPSIDWCETTPCLELFQAGARFVVGDFEVDSFTIPHDAVDPVGFRLSAEGIRFAIATDLGYITESIRYQLRSTELMLLESNHDLEMLKVGPYPWSLKQRVMSRVGHLSNEVACDFIAQDFDGSAPALILGHLSEHNNHPEIVRLMGEQALAKRGLATRLVIASQKQATEVFTY